MKQLILFFGFIFSVHSTSAQLVASPDLHLSPDSLKHDLQATSNDTLKMVLLTQLRYFYFFEKGNLDSALYYSQQLLPLTQKLNYKIDEAHAFDLIGDIMNFQHNPATLKTFFQGVKIAEDPGSENNILPRKYLQMMVYWHSNFNSLLIKNNWEPRYFRLAILGSLYQDLGHAYGKIMPNEQRLFFYLSKAMNTYKIQGDSLGLALVYINIAEYFRSTNQLDSCLLYAQKGFDGYTQYSGTQHGEENSALSLMGTVHFKKGNYALALRELRLSTSMGGFNYQLGENWLANFTLSEYFFQQGEIDSSIYYAGKAYTVAKKMDLPEEIQQAGTMLATGYERKGLTDSALKYFRLSLILNDSLNNADKTRKLQSQDFDEQLHRQELEDEKNKLKLYFLFGGIAALLIIAIALLRNNVLRKKSNISLHQKNEQISKTLSELKSAQAQLIQSEKMASLGELTAGIAHEIQNPLNFVNNFSEVNTELIGDLKSEKSKVRSERDEKLEDELLNEIKANEEKINHHGKRADAIVKAMLQHSQRSSGIKEPIAINSLADEYLRLAYHGLRAKDKSFNATMNTNYDETIGKINIIPQDIGRALLNLYNNAFYAVNEKKTQQQERFVPTVSVSTKKTNGKIEVIVKDNGDGIPQKVIDKIFQPFFTTKPTGQGTGLGLSLAYDIVKAHGGEIHVESKEREFTQFTIVLPV